MISSEDVIGLSECIPGLLGGVAPARISEIDLPPSAPDAGARESGRLAGTWTHRQLMGEDVDKSLLYLSASTGCLFGVKPSLPP